MVIRKTHTMPKLADFGDLDHAQASLSLSDTLFNFANQVVNQSFNVIFFTPLKTLKVSLIMNLLNEVSNWNEFDVWAVSQFSQHFGLWNFLITAQFLLVCMYHKIKAETSVKCWIFSLKYFHWNFYVALPQQVILTDSEQTKCKQTKSKNFNEKNFNEKFQHLRVSTLVLWYLWKETVQQ